MEPVPVGEVNSRVVSLQRALARQGIGLALIRQAADMYYYSGVLVDGFLAVAAEGEPLLLVRRPQGRDLASAWPVAFYRDFKELPRRLAQGGLEPRGALGLELDVMPAALYRRLAEQIFPQQPVQDLAPLIRKQRMIKSAYEVAQMRRAAAILDEAHEQVPRFLTPGISELELSAELEYRLRLLGHQGFIRVRNWDLEVFYGHVLSGISGLKLAYTDTPSGGPGLSAAFPQGPSLKKLAPGEPISIDLAACVNGYLVDMTRMYALESLPELAWEAWRLVEYLYRTFEAEARPGVAPGKVFHLLWEVVRSQGFQEGFMGLGADRVSFLGHGVGLELDEYPFLTARFPYPLEENSILAFEPKFFLPEIGMVGLEDTGRIHAGGVEWLTRSPRQITII